MGVSEKPAGMGPSRNEGFRWWIFAKFGTGMQEGSQVKGQGGGEEVLLVGLVALERHNGLLGRFGIHRVGQTREHYIVILLVNLLCVY